MFDKRQFKESFISGRIEFKRFLLHSENMKKIINNKIHRKYNK